MKADQADSEIHNKFYVADTDPEEEDDDKSGNNSASIHLEMSQSILINQSTFSSNFNLKLIKRRSNLLF